MNTFLMILFITLCVGSAATFIYMRIVHVGLHAFWAKLAASSLFVIGGFFALMMKDVVKDYMLFILMGLFFGMIGDALLELKLVYRPHDKQYTNGGITAFSLGHIFYVVGLSIYASAVKSIVVPIFVSLALGSVIATILLVNSNNLGIDFGDHKTPAYVYSFVTSIAVAYSIALAVLVPSLWFVAVALVLFLVSSLILSLIYWGGKSSNAMNIANLTGYYVAQILIMIALFVL